MTTDEKINSLITLLIHKANKFIWSENASTRGFVASYNHYRIHVYRNCQLRIADDFDCDFLPIQDLNGPCNSTLRFELAQTVSKLHSDRSTLIDKLITELNTL